VAVSVDVPDEDRLGDKLANVDHGSRVHGPQTTLELRDRGCTMVEEGLGERREDAVVSRIDHQDRFHPFPVRQKGSVHAIRTRTSAPTAGHSLASTLQTPSPYRLNSLMAGVTHCQPTRP
jgi:hypothetical protein